MTVLREVRGEPLIVLQSNSRQWVVSGWKTRTGYSKGSSTEYRLDSKINGVQNCRIIVKFLVLNTEHIIKWKK